MAHAVLRHLDARNAWAPVAHRRALVGLPLRRRTVMSRRAGILAMEKTIQPPRMPATHIAPSSLPVTADHRGFRSARVKCVRSPAVVTVVNHSPLARGRPQVEIKPQVLPCHAFFWGGLSPAQFLKEPRCTIVKFLFSSSSRSLFLQYYSF